MANPIPDGYNEVVFRHTTPTSSGEMNCIWGFVNNTEPAEEQIANIQAAWQENMLDMMGNAVTYLGCIYREGTGDDPITLEAPPEPGHTTTGGGGADMLPDMAAILLQKRTPLGGRRNRGRCYLPPPAINQTADSNSLSEGELVADQIKVDTFLAFLEASFQNPVLLHRSGPVAIPTIITSITVAARLATQRGRNRD